MARYKQFIKDTATLISGNVWAQGIAFAAYFAFTRLFSPEDFGIYNTFYSYIEILIIVSTCKYELAVVLGSDEQEAMTVGRLALRLNSFVALLLMAVVATICIAAGLTTPVGGVPAYIYLMLPVMVWLCGTSRVYTALLNRLRNFRQIALSEMIASTSGVVAKLLMGIPHFAATALHTVGLPFGTVIGRLVGNINLRLSVASVAPDLQSGFLLHRINNPAQSGSIRQAAKKFRNFPLFTMPKELVNSVSYNLPFIWLAHLFEMDEVGLFALALTFTFRPVNILNSAFEKLLYVRIAARVRDHQPVKGDILRFLGLLNVAALPLFTVVFLFADDIFAFLFGGRWSGCGYYIRCLLPWVFVNLSSTTIMFLSNIFSRQRTEFLFYIILLLLRVASMLAGVLCGSFKLAILLFSLSGALVSAALLLWLIHLVNLYEAKSAA